MPIKISKPVPVVTHLALLIDSSGSMTGFESQVIKSTNQILEDLQAKAKELDQEVVVSIYSFGGTVDTLMQNRPIKESPRLRAGDYEANGGTPMYDALSLAIGHLEAIDKPSVANLVTVITDGQEVGSRVGASTINSRMAKLTQSDRWTFTFLIPNGNRAEIETRLSAVAPGNIQEWEVSSKGLKETTARVSGNYGNYLNLRATGATKSTGFFTASVNSSQAKLAKAQLMDVQGDFKEMTVRTQDPKTIQDFIESRGLHFMKGRAFYQLSKPEKVQSHKEILLREIKTGSVYGGAQARDILGLPHYQEVKVKPADLSNWDIFVQSTSNNRKLVVGTNLLYLK